MLSVAPQSDMLCVQREAVREPLLESPFCHFKPLALALSPLTFVFSGGILAQRPGCLLYHFPTLPLSVNPGAGVMEKSIDQSTEKSQTNLSKRTVSD